MDIGTKIKKLRDENHLSQSELAFQLGISQRTLHNIESGNSKKIDFLLMDKICQFFDKDFEYFLDSKTDDTINCHQSIDEMNLVSELFFQQFIDIIQKNKDDIHELKKKLDFEQ